MTPERGTRESVVRGVAPARSEFIRRGTLLLDVAEPAPGDERAHMSRVRLAIEAFGLAVFSFIIMTAISAKGTAILSVFLAAAALSNNFSAILKENRDDIFTHKRSSWEANRDTAAGIFALFAGLFLAYLVATAFSKDLSVFEFAFDSASLHADTIRTRHFGRPLPLFLHNLAVMATFSVLAFVYRSYGALLALGFNAFVWAVTITTLIAREASWKVTLIGSIAVTPHIVIEAMAYVFASMAGVFLSLGVAKYALKDPVLRQVFRASLSLLGASVLCLLVGALAEGWFAPAVISLIE